MAIAITENEKKEGNLQENPVDIHHLLLLLIININFIKTGEIYEKRNQSCLFYISSKNFIINYIFCGC